MSARGLAVVPAVVAAVALATACGSTVPLTSAQHGQVFGGTGLGGPTAATDGTVGGAPVALGGQVTAPGTTPHPGPAGVALPSDQGSVVSGVVQGFGVTGKTVTIGLPYSPGADAVAAQLGAASVTSGDTKAVASAVIADINAHGGVLGRKLVPVYHQYDAASTESVDQKSAEACADYVSDHRTFVVLDTGRSSFLECVTKKALVVSSDDYGFGTGDFVHYPYFVDTNTVVLERAMAGWVRTLVSQQYFTPWNSIRGTPGQTPAKVGLLSVDYPAVNKAVEGVLLPGLKAAGHPVDANNYVKLDNGNSTADAPRTIAAIQNAVLRFQSNGVTHVLIFDNAGGVTLFFGKSADGQKYYPRWGITTQNTMQAWIESGDVSAKQARGSAGLGWEPNYDLPTAETGPSSRWSTQPRKHCNDVLRRAGIQSPSHNAELIALEFCDRLFFLAHVMNQMNPKQVTREEFVRVVDALGSSYVSPSVQRTRFAASQHDGVALGYPLRFVGACTCMRYGVAFSLS